MKDHKSQGEHLYSFFYTLFKRKYFILAVFLTTFGGILFGTFLVTRLWKATAKIRVQNSPKQQLTMFEGMTTPGTTITGINPANDVIPLLTSRELAERIVLEFRRDEIWKRRMEAPEGLRDEIFFFMDNYINPMAYLSKLGISPKSPVNYLAKAVGELQNDLEQIELEADTTIVNVSIWGESPQTATDMTNMLVQLLMEKNIEFSRAPIVEMIKLTRNQLGEVERNLRDVQQRLKAFKQETGFVLFSEEANILLQRLDMYESKLMELEGQLLSMKLEKRSDHPDMKSLEVVIEEYRNVMIPEVKEELQSLSMEDIVYQNLQEELQIREGLYTMLEEKVLALELMRDSPIGDLEIKIVDHARVYSNVRPDWPKAMINSVLGFIASIFTGIFLAFFVEYWDSSYRSVMKLEEDIKVTVLGAIPRFSWLDKRRLFNQFGAKSDVPKEDQYSEGDNDQRESRSLMQYSLLADQLLLDEKAKHGRRYLVTSPGQGEGKTYVVALLSRILASHGKRVLVIEANFRTPSFGAFLGRFSRFRKSTAGRRTIGLFDFCVGAVELSDVVTDVRGIDVIFAGSPPSPLTDYSGVLSTLKTRDELHQLMREYDFVFIDSPNIKEYRDPNLLSALSDGVVLVAEANKTPRRAILMALQRLKDLDSNLEGIILNKRVNYIPNAIQNLINTI